MLRSPFLAHFLPPSSTLRRESPFLLPHGFRAGGGLGVWGVSQDHMKKGSPRKGWDLAQGAWQNEDWGLGT